MERRKYKRLSYEDRLRAEKMYKTGMSIAQVAEQLGVTRSTIYRDYKRGGGQQNPYLQRRTRPAKSI